MWNDSLYNPGRMRTSVHSVAVLVSAAFVALSATSAWCQAPISERAVLYEEDRTSNGRQLNGVVVWTDLMSSKPGHELDRVVRACIRVPARNLNIVLSLRHNTDMSVSASHVVSVVVKTTGNGPRQVVSEIRGLLMKPNPGGRGNPIAARMVKVADNVFQLNLSSQASDLRRNTQLLTSEAWLSLALVYADGRRAVAAIEKGASGDRAIKEAFAAWDEDASASRPDAAAPSPLAEDLDGGCEFFVSGSEHVPGMRSETWAVRDTERRR
jgi:hypothetical protein